MAVERNHMAIAVTDMFRLEDALAAREPSLTLSDIHIKINESEGKWCIHDSSNAIIYCMRWDEGTWEIV